MNKLLVVLVMLAQFYVLPVFARDYEIELLIFERVTPSPDTEEQWNAGSNQILAHQEELRDSSTSSVKLPLKQGVSRLNRLEKELLGSGYRLLSSSHWRQPGEVFQNAPVVNVSRADNRMLGYLKIYNTSLIFADINLGLVDPLVDPHQPSYFISEKRRLKFKEIHYFDHPRFGAILGVWPAEQ
ncbi:MAG: CsiV family protein [Gammaproteobacteria bacterium]